MVSEGPPNTGPHPGVIDDTEHLRARTLERDGPHLMAQDDSVLVLPSFAGADLNLVRISRSRPRRRDRAHGRAAGPVVRLVGDNQAAPSLPLLLAPSRRLEIEDDD